VTWLLGATWLLLGVLVTFLVMAGRVLERRWERDRPGWHDSAAPGVPGLGEAPTGVHHRMGPSGRPRRGR
jgi:hypothetical protein